MQQFGASASCTVVHWHKSGEVDNYYTSHDSISWPSVHQKLSNLVKIWRSFDKNKLGHFLDHPVVYANLSLFLCFSKVLLECTTLLCTTSMKLSVGLKMCLRWLVPCTALNVLIASLQPSSLRIYHWMPGETGLTDFYQRSHADEFWICSSCYSGPEKSWKWDIHEKSLEFV